MVLRKIYQRFLLLSALEADEAAPWFPLCEEAAMSLSKRLKAGVREVDWEPLLENAAAAMAFCRYTAVNASENTAESFSVGDIRIAQNVREKAAMAERIKNEALHSIASILEDDDFVFRRCGGK